MGWRWGETYTEEEPNALLPEEVAPFMSKFKELHAQHFGIRCTTPVWLVRAEGRMIGA